MPSGTAEIYGSRLCRNCGVKTATIKFTGDGGVMAYIHGWYEDWCEQCVIQAQLKHAEESAAKIPELRRALEEWYASND